MAPLGKGACHRAVWSQGSDADRASWSNDTGGGQAVEACLSWLETVTQISGNWDRKVPREACVGSLLKVSPHCMFL